MRIVNGIKRISAQMRRDRKFVFFSLRNSLYSRITRVWDSNQKCRNICVTAFIYERLKKEFGGVLDNTDSPVMGGYSASCEKVIWMCWLQGVDNAPLLVRRCVDNTKKRFPDWKIVIITSDNYREYTHIPDYIQHKWKAGQMKDAHFSDLIRLDVLIKYGGVWIDPTVYCSCDSMPEYITKPNLFIYTSFSLNEIEVSKISNWLIGAKSQNKFLVCTQKLLYSYWNKYDFSINYFLFHLFFTMVTEKYEEDWDEIPKFNNLNPHVLQWEFGKKYDQERLRTIARFADFHKLTYRLEQTCNTEGSFFDVMINQGKMDF